jgi:predicted RNA binding protein YcfA (HicA-like mRNA interferase family)
MKLPRDLGGEELARLLSRYGYRETHRAGSHIRLTASEPSEHHITIPAHPSLKVGTLSAILAEVAAHLRKTKADLIAELFG